MTAVVASPGTIAWCMLLWIWIGSAFAMSGVWMYARHTNNVGYVDVAWSALMGLMGIAAAVGSHGAFAPRLMVAILMATWAARLATHLFVRVHGQAEDGRYAYLRKHWDGSPTRFFLFFQAQAVSIALFALPLLVAASNPAEGFNTSIIAAIVLWLVAVGGESVADKQLAAWVADPANRGKTCRRGLWAWSRHPNYFFEWLHWFAYVLIAIGGPLWWIALSGPLVMFAFLYRVTGIPYTEAQALRSRGDDYRAYQHDVSAFFPRPPRHRFR